jgi:hypothetical protein
MRLSPFVCLLSLSSAGPLLTGCGGSTGTAAAASLESLAVTPADAGVLAGASAQLIATKVATFNTTAGLALGVAAGKVTVTATAAAVSGSIFNVHFTATATSWDNSCASLEGQADTATMSFSDFGLTDSTLPINWTWK